MKKIDYKLKFKKLFTLSIYLIVVTLLNTNLVFAQNKDESYQFSYALKLYNEKFYDLASQEFSQYITRFIDEKSVPDAHFYLAKCYEKLQKENLAVIEYKKLALDFPKHPKATAAWQQSGKLYIKMGNLKEAAKAFENIQILYSDTEAAPEALLNAGKVYFEMKDFTNGRRVLNDIISRYSENSFVYEAELYIAKIAIKDGNLPLGINKLKKLIVNRDNPLVVDAKLELIETYLNMNNLARAENLLAGIKPKQKNINLIKQEVRLLWKKRNYKKSVKILQNRLIKDERNKFALMKMLIDAYMLNKNYSDALNLYNKIPEQFLTEQFKHKHLILLIKENNFKKFLLELKKHETNVSEDIIKEILTDALQGMENTKSYKTMKELLVWIKLQFSFEEFNNKYAKYYFISLFKNKEYNELDRYLSKNIDRLKILSIIDDALFFRGKLMLQKRNYHNAWENFKEIVNKYPYSPYVQFAQKEKEKIEKYYLKNDQMATSTVINFYGNLINEKDKSILNLNLGEMCAVQAKDFTLSLVYYNKALNESNTKLKSKIYLRMYEAAWAIYKKDEKNNNQYIDSAKIFLKNYLELENNSKQKAEISMNYFKNTINKIKKDNKRKLQILKKITEWRKSKVISLEKLNDLYFSLLPQDSVLNIIKRNKGDVRVANKDYWLWKTANIAFQEKDMEMASSLYLQILQNYSLSMYVKDASQNLLNIYSKNNDWKKYKQITLFVKENFWYDEGIKFNEINSNSWLNNGENDKLISSFKQNYKNQTKDVILLKELYPQYKNDCYNVGIAYYNLNKIDSSSYYLNIFLALSHKGDWRQDNIYRILGSLMLTRNNEKDAIWYLSKFADENQKEDFINVKDKLIELYEKNKEYKNVKNICLLLTKKFPTHKKLIKWEYYLNKANIRINKGKNFTAAINLFQKKFKKNKLYKKYLGELYIDFVYLSKDLKNFKTAENILKKAQKLKVKDQKPHILYLYGNLATIQNKDKEALKYLSEFTGKYTDNEYLTNVYLTLGHLYYRSEKKSDALEAYNRAVNAAKNSADLELALNNLIVLNKELGFWDGVLKNCRRYLQEFPEHFTKVEKQVWIGLSYSRLNRFDEAINYFKKIKPFAGSEREPEIQFYIGEAYFNSGRYQESISEFLKIPLLSKKTELQWEASALYYAGQAYERLGKKSEAIHMYKEIIKRPGILWELKKEAQKKISQLN